MFSIEPESRAEARTQRRATAYRILGAVVFAFFRHGDRWLAATALTPRQYHPQKRARLNAAKARRRRHTHTSGKNLPGRPRPVWTTDFDEG